MRRWRFASIVVPAAGGCTPSTCAATTRPTPTTCAWSWHADRDLAGGGPPMSTLNVLYRDVDRMPYLLTLRACAARTGLELNILRSGPQYPGWADRLERGDVQMIAENYWGLQTFRAKGLPFVTVASVVSRMTEMLVADASVQTVDDLRGKKLAVRGGGPQLFLPALWLADQGLIHDV